MENKKDDKRFVKVKCHECGNEQVIFGRSATKVVCLKCNADIAYPTGGKSKIVAEIIDLI